MLTKSFPEQSVRNLENFHRFAEGQNPRMVEGRPGGKVSERPLPNDLLGLTQSLLESDPHPEAWGAAWGQLVPTLGTVAEIGQRVANLGYTSKDTHNLCMVLVKAARQQSSPAQALLEGARVCSFDARGREALAGRLTEVRGKAPRLTPSSSRKAGWPARLLTMRRWAS